jgi:hypothetical protein
MAVNRYQNTKWREIRPQNFFHFKTLQNLPKLGLLFENISSSREEYFNGGLLERTA